MAVLLLASLKIPTKRESTQRNVIRPLSKRFSSTPKPPRSKLEYAAKQMAHTVDGRNPAPPKNPWDDDFPVNTNKQWFPEVSTCELDFDHPQHQPCYLGGGHLLLTFQVSQEKILLPANPQSKGQNDALLGLKKPRYPLVGPRNPLEVPQTVWVLVKIQPPGIGPQV